jgi:transcriptional regulator with XRE-family HTH domain
MPVNPETLAELFAKARKDIGLSLAEVSRASGLSLSAIRNIEHGRSHGRIQTVAALAETYGRRLSEMIADAEEREPS